MERGEPFKVVGPPGTGKTTLVRMAVSGVDHVYVSCLQLRKPKLILAHTDSGMPVILVELPHRRSPSMESCVIEMRPYTAGSTRRS
ncbi:MAG: AAA family ATPase [Nanopusillaceae archaeon]